MKQEKTEFSVAFISILYAFSKELIVESTYELLDNVKINCLLTGFIKGLAVSAKTDEERAAIMKCSQEYAHFVAKGPILDKEFFDKIKALMEKIEEQEKFSSHHNN